MRRDQWIAGNQTYTQPYLTHTEEDGDTAWVRIGEPISIAFILAERDRISREALSGAEAVEIALRNGVVPRNVHGPEQDVEDALALAADAAYQRLDAEKQFRVRGKARKLLALERSRPSSPDFTPADERWA